MKIHLYGDSYFEDHLSIRYNHDSFIDKLKDEYGAQNVINHGKSGAGPHYNLPLIAKHIQQGQIERGDVLLCHISGTTRVEFPYHEGTVNEFYWDHNLKKSFCYDENMKLKDFQIKAKRFYDEYRNEIDFAYLTFNDLLLYSGVNLTGFLYSVSQSLGVKTFVFDGENNFYNNCFFRLNNKNFHYSKKKLFEVSTEEIFFDEVDSIVNVLKEDLRKNHLSEENHIVLFDVIVKFINSELDENELFWKCNFKHSADVFNIINEKHPFKEKFIYD